MRKILLSIKPIYIEAIKSRKKQVEYRSWRPSCLVPFKVLIYATKPIGTIIGEFDVFEIYEDSKDNLWKKTKDIGGISYELFSNYFSNKNRCYAFQIDNFIEYKTPITLNSIGIQHVPQRFIFLDKED